MPVELTESLRHDARDYPARRSANGSSPDTETEPQNPLHRDHGDTQDEVILLGQPPLRKYLKYVEGKVVNGDSFDRKTLVEDWGRANAYYQELEESERGLADEIDVQDLDPALVPLAADVTTDPRYRRTFDTLPAKFAMVELDKLTLFQTWVTRQFTDRLQARLGAAPDPAALFRFCQPPEVSEAPVKVRKVGSGRYIFTSESTDFRPHNPVLLRPDQIRDHQSFGPISGVVGLVVGFGSNFLTAIRQGEDGRVLLHNGYHRAYALRALGITHAPCIIRTVSNQDELQIAAVQKVVQNPDFYFASARPPLMKDFFDPKLRKVHQVYQTLKMIEVEFEVREYNVKA